MRFSTAEQLKNRTESPALLCLFRFTAQYTHTGTHHWLTLWSYCNLLHCAPLLSTSKILTYWNCSSKLSPLETPWRIRASESFQQPLQHKPLTRIIPMIQIRGKRLLTIIKGDVMTRDDAVTKLWKTLIIPPPVYSKVKQVYCHVKTQCASITTEKQTY